MKPMLAAIAVSLLCLSPVRTNAVQTAGPVIVFEIVNGAVEMQMFAAEAPKSVARIVELAKSGFYRGLRIHRVTASLAQFGDPGTRDMSRRDYWGNGGSGKPIGVAEMSKKRTHVRGTVGLAHAGYAQMADSQLYIMKTASPGLDGKHAIVGQVTKGMDVVDKLQVADTIKNVTVR